MQNHFRWTLATTLAGFALLTASAVSLAQTPGPKSPDAHNPAAEQQAPAKPDEPLSEKLDKNEGVLVPPSGVDPKIHIDPPAETGDRMPVIVPPGEPGGNQQIQPK